MKYSISLTGIIVTVALFLSACTSGMKGDLCKKWTMDSSVMQDSIKASKAKMDAQVKLLNDSIAAAGSDSEKVSELEMNKTMRMSMYDYSSKMMSSLDSVMRTMYMEFKNDGSFEYNMGGKITTGKWTLDEANKKLITKEDGGEADTLHVDAVSANKLTFSRGNGSQQQMSLVPFK
jgi:hypothetical protein